MCVEVEGPGTVRVCWVGKVAAEFAWNGDQSSSSSPLLLDVVAASLGGLGVAS